MTDRTTPQEASRAAFEAWMRDKHSAHPLHTHKPADSIYGHVDGSVEYLNSGAQHKWIGWQAATQARDADAERYRWLRVPGRTLYEKWIDNDGSPQELDAAIDAALKEQA